MNDSRLYSAPSICDGSRSWVRPRGNLRMMVYPVLAIFLICCGVASTGWAAPNLLVILADDMGYGDTGFMGSRSLKTPYLDALARSGVYCSQAYVTSPVCSTSRAGLMTGRDPRRFGYEENLNQAASRYDTRPELLGLVPGEHTLGDHLGEAGSMPRH